MNDAASNENNSEWENTLEFIRFLEQILVNQSAPLAVHQERLSRLQNMYNQLLELKHIKESMLEQIPVNNVDSVARPTSDSSTEDLDSRAEAALEEALSDFK